MAEFEGMSKTSDFQEALEDAVQKALRAITHTDPMVSYSVKRITGVRGGIAGLREITVVIDTDAR
jgi:hypothetical protein